MKVQIRPGKGVGPSTVFVEHNLSPDLVEMIASRWQTDDERAKGHKIVKYLFGQDCRVTYSQYAGCSCPCSPGYRVHDNCGREIFITL